MKNEILLDDQHRYSVDGQFKPGVTEVLASSGLSISYERLDPFYAQRGTMIHEAIRLDLEGDLHYEALDERIRPYIDRFRAIRKNLGLAPGLTEQSLYHSTLGYCGTLDYIGECEALGREVVIDWKSGKIERYHDLQLSAYHALAMRSSMFQSQPTIGIISLHENPGSRAIRWMEGDQAQAIFPVFQAALTVHRARKVYNP